MSYGKINQLGIINLGTDQSVCGGEYQSSLSYTERASVLFN